MEKTNHQLNLTPEFKWNKRNKQERKQKAPKQRRANKKQQQQYNKTLKLISWKKDSLQQ